MLLVSYSGPHIRTTFADAQKLSKYLENVALNVL